MDIEQILDLMRHTPWNWYYVCDWEYFCPGITPEKYQESFARYASRQETLDAYRELRERGYSPARSLEPFHGLLSYNAEKGVHTGYDAYRAYFP